MSEKIYDERGRLQEPLWYIIAVTTQWEKRVLKSIQALSKMERWKDQIFDAALPSYFETNAKGKVVEKLHYTQYVYVHMILNNETWNAIDKVDGFRAFAGNEKPLDDVEVRNFFKMIGRETELSTQKPVSYQQGEVVYLNIPDQPAFHKKEAKIYEVSTDKNEVTVLIDMFGKETRMKVEREQIEKK